MTEQDVVPQKPSISWVKQLYYYLILGVSILFLSIGAFTFSRANLYYFVFTEAQENSYGYEGICNQPKTINYPQINKIEATQTQDQFPTQKDIDSCISKQKNRQYQSDILNSILTLIIAGIVLGLHLKYVKLKE